MKKLATLILATGVALTSQAQLKTPQPSPFQSVTQAFGLGEIKIEYSRPSVKDRVIFGDLVPYNKIWRTGANASTKITIGDDVKIDGNSLPAGTYAIYTMPAQNEWQVMFYKDLTLGGNTDGYKKEDEVLNVKVKPVAMNDKMETFTINVNNVMPTSCTIDLMWDKTKVSVPVTTDIDAKIMKSIDKEMSDNRPYYQAASYYYDNGKDLNKALEWVNKAAEKTPNAYWVLNTKAKIQYKLKDYAGAIKSAEASLVKAKESGDNSYIKQNEKLIADAKKMGK
ncbi:MAG: DUF2911 domain-containing protein [Bacteroidetes bacterium]|jgi:hypothetical protein|nr:DUF2911 domain-containing protein [Bacteroidota bacterium]